MSQFATALVLSLCEAAVRAQWGLLASIPGVNQWAFVSRWSKISGGFESLIINEKLNSVQEHSQELPPAFCPHSWGVSIRVFVIIQNVFKPNWELQGWERQKPKRENGNREPHWQISKFLLTLP